MAHAVHAEPTGHVSETTRHVITAILGVVGVVAAALGTWMAYGPADATITIGLFDWSWNVADINELWAPWLMISGGLVAAFSMGWEAVRAQADANPWVVALEGLLLVGGLAAAVIGVVLLF
jgi:hypothetical protein